MTSKAVLDFLDQRNRPYSALDIFNGLKQEGSTQGAIQKTLDSLVAEGLVRQKVYGKQKVYFITQNTNITSKEVDEEILALDRQINAITSKTRQVTEKLKATTERFEEAKALAEALEKKVALEAKLRELKMALKQFEGVKLVSTEVKNKVQQEYDKYLGVYRKRKRLCLDMLDAILENYPKTKKHLYEDIGIETDEDVGFTI